MAKITSTIANAIKHWYIPMIIGLLFIIFWGYIFTVPLEAYMTLSILFSVSFIISWVLEIFFAIQNRKELDSWAWYLTAWVFGLIVWILLLINQETSMAILPFVVGFVLLLRSVQLMGIAFDLKKYKVIRWWNLAIIGVIGIVISILLILNPTFTGISLVVLTALGFIILWVALIVLSFDLKKVKKVAKKVKEEIKEMIEEWKEYFDEYMDDDDDED